MSAPGSSVLALLLLAGAPSPAAAQDPPPIGAPAGFGAESVDEERISLPAGAPLRDRPHARAPAAVVLDAPAELPLVERAGGWVRVRLGARKLWALIDPAAGSPRAAVGEGRADPALLARALARLRPADSGEAGAGTGEIPEDARRLGPWRLATDLDPAASRDLLTFLDRVAAQVPELHRSRYGVGSAAEAAAVGSETVVLYAREADYRDLARLDAALGGLDEGGFAGFGIAALYAEGRDRDDLAALLVHELVHLLDARLFGPDLPPWLEEGLANDLGYSRIGPGGRLDPTGLGGREEVRARTRGVGSPGAREEGIEVTVASGGALAARSRLVEAIARGAALPLSALVALDWDAMSDPARRDLAYAESAFFVRFLLDPRPGRAERFRRFLAGVAAGGAADGAALLDALGESWSDLERAFHRWLGSGGA